MSPGTLYPILHDLQQAGFLTCQEHVVHGKRRKSYRITAAGRRVLRGARTKLRELFAEVIDDVDKKAAARR